MQMQLHCCKRELQSFLSLVYRGCTSKQRVKLFLFKPVRSCYQLSTRRKGRKILCFCSAQTYSTVSLLFQLERLRRRPVLSLLAKMKVHKNSQILFCKSPQSKYRKIMKISPGAYIFQRPFLRGLYSEGLIYRGKFAFESRLGQSYSWKEIYRFCFVLLEGKFQVQAPGGLIFGGAI